MRSRVHTELRPSVVGGALVYGGLGVVPARFDLVEGLVAEGDVGGGEGLVRVRSKNLPSSLASRATATRLTRSLAPGVRRKNRLNAASLGKQQSLGS